MKALSLRLALLPLCAAGAVLALEVSAQTPALRLAQAEAIQAPSTVDPGRTVRVTVPGAAGGRIELWGPVTQSGRGRRLEAFPLSGGTARVTAPARPGSYELRHVTPAGSVSARTSFDVAAVPVILSVPQQLGAGIPGAVRWRGPARPGDRLQIVDPASGAVVAEAAAEGTPGAENVTMIRAPEAVGEYRLRYLEGARGAVLRALPIRVGPSRTWMRAPAQVAAGASFPVRWYGPAEPGQAFEILDPASGSAVASARAEAGPTSVSASLRAPARAGRYRVRFVNTETGQVHSDLPLIVD